MDRARHRFQPTADRISAHSISWIATMETNYPSLPNGPVMCKTCATSGRSVEMQRHPLNASYEDASSLAVDKNLKTYRCPDCESVSVFSVD